MVAPRVLVYPAFNARYYSLYIEGLRRVVGASRMRYTSRGFPTFGPDCLAMEFQAERTVRIYLHSNDMPELSPGGLEWCDVFGKVNLDPTTIPTEHEKKVYPLGPTFAVKVWGPVIAEARGLTNYIRGWSGCAQPREHVANYRGQYRSRFSEREYQPSPSRPDYIFFNAAIWEREPEANRVRARFVEAARNIDGVTFEGGLTPRKSARGSDSFDGSEFAEFQSRRYSPNEYLARTKVSAVALNNPAYRDCHSWRLAEGLALGKAIVSTPIVRKLPAPLEHRKQIHYVDGTTEGFQSAIEEICSDHEYRMSLESNARNYYETYLSPESVIERTMRVAGVDPY